MLYYCYFQRVEHSGIIYCEIKSTYTYIHTNLYSAKIVETNQVR